MRVVVVCVGGVHRRVCEEVCSAQVCVGGVYRRVCEESGVCWWCVLKSA